jgi:hypothetical protein
LIRQDFLVGAKFSDPAQRLRSKFRQHLMVWASPRILATLILALAIPGGMHDVLHPNEMRAIRAIQTIGKQFFVRQSFSHQFDDYRETEGLHQS